MFEEITKEICNEYNKNGLYARILQELNNLYETELSTSGDKEKAREYALLHIGMYELFKLSTQETKLIEEYNEFKLKYVKYIKYGILSIIIMPIIFLAVLFTVESKIIFLIMWIVSIIGIACFLIIIEYKNYGYKEKIGEIKKYEKYN